MEKLKENNKILNTIILIIFISLSLFVGAKHEPWADEAQAWLIARDASIYDIIFHIARYEGSPVMWHLLLKFFIVLKLPYNYYFLVPIFFQSIGIYIILYKLKINNLYKIILPFTFFIGFEYTIKARSYCLLLPILATIAMIYDDRKEHVYLYNFFVLLLSFVSLHGTVISGTLYLIEIIEILKSFDEKRNLKKISKEIISVALISLLYIFIVATVFPPNDIYVNIALGNIDDSNVVIAFLYWTIKILEAFTLKFKDYFKFGIPSFVLMVAIFICVLKSNKKKTLFLSLFLLPVIFICFVRVSNQHIGIIFYSFLFAVYLVKDEVTDKCKEVFFVLFTIVLCIQVIWYVDSAKAEISLDYSAGKKVSEYIKSLDYENKKIYASGYYVVSILPYFDNNIFYGERGESTFYSWSKKNLDWVRASSEEYIYPDILSDYPDIVILDDHAKRK